MSHLLRLQLECQIAEALDTRKKDGTPVFDQTNLEVCVAGTFANDKFIVIKNKTNRQNNNPDQTLKQHHEYEPIRVREGDQREETS
jgi:hypothetical protein